MFTGIVEELGTVLAVEKKKNLYTLSLRAPKVTRGCKIGESIAIDGVCLSISKIKGQVFTFDLIKETLDHTTLGLLSAHSKVNLERALKVGARFGGHIVTGHVDGLGKITDIRRDKNYVEFVIATPPGVKSLIVPKGSICIHGISLTVGKVGAINNRPNGNYFTVYMIPLTMQLTTMAEKKTGDFVNIEADIIARYVLNAK